MSLGEKDDSVYDHTLVSSTPRKPSSVDDELSIHHFEDTPANLRPSSSTPTITSTSTPNPIDKHPNPNPSQAYKLTHELKPSKSTSTLGYDFPTWKKWSILCVIFIVQLSMNFNAAVYPNVAQGLSDHFGISLPTARIGQMIFLVAYAFGSELWAPWSEELGRWPVLQLSLFLVNIWQIPCALAPTYSTIVVFRFLGGLSSAGGSVTLGMIADMWDIDNQQFAVAFIVFSSVAGSSIGPVAGAFIEKYLSWHWNFWCQLIFGVVTQVIHFWVVPETRSSVILDREARRRRGRGEDVWGPGEVKERRFEMREILRTWARPFVMFAREPIVLCLSLLSGFSDGLIFCFMEAFQPVYQQWGFGTIQLGLAFIPINIGYVIAYLSYLYPIMKHRKIMRRDPSLLTPESRLWWLLFTAPLEALGLFGFAWTTLGPPRVHWIAPMLFSVLIAIANYCIYMSTIDYMVASYGVYSASATGGNALARDFIAGISALYATPLYNNLGPHSLQWASTLLAFLAVLVTIPIYVFYWKGPEIRGASRFAMSLASERVGKAGAGAGVVGEKGEKGVGVGVGKGGEEEKGEEVREEGGKLV